MTTELKLPDLGEGIESGDVLEVLVNEGDVIEKGQGIVEIETDKATVEVPSTHAGKVTAIHVAEGQSVPIGSLLITLEVAEAAAAEPPQSRPSEPAEASEPAPSRPTTPRVEPSSAGPPEVDHATPAEPSPAKKGPSAAPINESTPPRPAPLQQATAAPTAAPAATAASTKSRIAPAGPAVRRFAREVGVDLNAVQGTGPSGRITRDDVLAVVRKSNQGNASAAETAQASTTVSKTTPATPPSPAAEEQASDNWGPVRIERMSKIRKTIAAKMHESWTTVPRVTNFDDADVTSLEKMRRASKADYAKTGVKLTSMPFIIKAAAMALRSHPLLNAKIDMEEGQIVYKDYVNIGVAVDTDRGLVVPSLRQADQLSIPQIARALGDIAESARTGEFAVEDLRGSTFTISNLGAIGGTYSTPIINTPEVAILLVGRARKMPVVVEDEIVIRLMMPLSLSYDHRLVDGGAAARFLNEVIGYLSRPSRLLMAP